MSNIESCNPSEICVVHFRIVMAWVNHVEVLENTEHQLIGSIVDFIPVRCCCFNRMSTSLFVAGRTDILFVLWAEFCWTVLLISFDDIELHWPESFDEWLCPSISCLIGYIWETFDLSKCIEGSLLSPKPLSFGWTNDLFNNNDSLTLDGILLCKHKCRRFPSGSWM